MLFADRVAVVTGAAGYIGYETCKMFGESGVSVALTDVTESGVEASVASLESLGITVRGYVIDVTDRESVVSGFSQIESDFGKIDILVNNAGVWEHRDVRGQQAMEMVAEEEWKRIFAINLEGTYRCMQAALPGMVKRGYGRIVNLGSIAGVSGLPGYADYSAAKAGVIMMSKVVAMEHAKHGITVNSVSPGMIHRTPAANSGTWLGRNGQGDEVARAILFLADDDSGYITGVDIPVDGGRVLGPHGASMK